ncbi:Rad23 UV excision repair protein family [Actinidia rufa]|uniref:Ubiquitin receptor RAD23 n=1 Tax=Actinidia rufa TaxID=165716 RepID=A0A7J0E8T9_9ERIC|nr:Rad23 UV excision repair protein family [Actinidia rufa]
MRSSPWSDLHAGGVWSGLTPAIYFCSSVQVALQISEVADVKKNIETVQGSDVYPATQQMLIHQGKVLKDATTLDENKVAENSFVVIMLNVILALIMWRYFDFGAESVYNAETIVVEQGIILQLSLLFVGSLPMVFISAPESQLHCAGPTCEFFDSFNPAINSISTSCANCQDGIPEQAEVPPAAQAPASGQAMNPPAQGPPPAVLNSGPNANPLNLFPQGLSNVGSNASPGNLDFLRNSQQFQALRTMVQANPQILQPMLQELGKQNPHLMRLIQEHQADFLRLINEPGEGEGNILEQLGGAVPQAVTITEEEREAIERVLPFIANFMKCNNVMGYLLTVSIGVSWSIMHVP